MTPTRAREIAESEGASGIYSYNHEKATTAVTKIILAACAEQAIETRRAALTEAIDECERRSETIKSCSSDGFVYRQACADCVAYIELLRDGENAAAERLRDQG